MKRLLILFVGLVAFGLVPAMFADLADYSLNVNGTTYCPTTAGSPALCSSFGGLAAVPSLSSSLDTTFPGGTGLGTVTLTYNPGPGSFFTSLWLFENLFPATAQNEFGVAVGSPQAGESWQIDVPDATYVGELGVAGAGTIVANNAANTLSNTNFVPGGTDNFDAQCGLLVTDATCNDYTSMALGFNFVLGAGEKEIVTFRVSTTAPASGFYLRQVAPVDAANDAEIDYFYSATAVTVPIETNGVPEPSTWVLVVTMGILMLLFRRRLAA
ncbi:MAG: PEP-CTERM sorting domain-containing protein [Acidobacteriia bacterium]|nr:PEP-CTERM sorting domain-containing protein [Terriglobia bacterium]